PFVLPIQRGLRGMDFSGLQLGVGMGERFTLFTTPDLTIACQKRLHFLSVPIFLTLTSPVLVFQRDYLQSGFIHNLTVPSWSPPDANPRLSRVKAIERTPPRWPTSVDCSFQVSTCHNLIFPSPLQEPIILPS